MKWDLIIFDCDGVLVDEAIGNRFIAEALPLGIETSTDESWGIFRWKKPK